MIKIRRRARKSFSVGAPPGTLVAHPDAAPSSIQVIGYDQERLVEEVISDPESLKKYLDQYRITWINVNGLKDVGKIEKIGEVLGIHKLALEDVLNGQHRAKTEDFDEHLFIVLRMVESPQNFYLEQVSMFIGANYILTFQEHEGDCLEPVRERLRKPSGRIRQNDVSYLGYAVIDAIIDGYLPVLEHIGDVLEHNENEILLGPKPSHLTTLQQLKRVLINIRRAVWPVREMINSLIRDDNPFISEYTSVYLRDCYDHAVHVIDMVESYREICSDLMNAYMSSVSNRMNEVMKVLTIIATIFIPLSFIAGLFGMNFSHDASPFNMPELYWKYGYFGALIVMAVIAIAMLLYFRSRGWLGSDDKFNDRTNKGD